jgi:hypothetical protein
VPFDPAALKALADGGGLVLFLAHVVIDAVGLFRQWWVDGAHYREVRDERNSLRVELKAAYKTIDRQTVQLARERRIRAPTVPMSRLRALVDRLLPWYDPASEARVHHDVKRRSPSSTAARHRADGRSSTPRATASAAPTRRTPTGSAVEPHRRRADHRPVVAWVATALLVTRAVQRPRIGALTERAALSVLLSLFGTLCVVLVYNTESGPLDHRRRARADGVPRLPVPDAARLAGVGAAVPHEPAGRRAMSIVYVRTKAGRVHKADGPTAFAGRRALQPRRRAGHEEEITLMDLERAQPRDLCGFCWPAVKADAEQGE